MGISASDKKAKRDDLGIIFHITPVKHMLCPILRTVLSREGSLRFLLRNKENYL